MVDKNQSNRRSYLKAIGGSLGALALTGTAEAKPSDKNDKKKKPPGLDSGKPPGLDPNFDPHNIDEVRGFNVAIRRANENALNKIGKKLSDKQKEAIKDSNKVTTKIIKEKKKVNGEMIVTNTTIKSDDSVAKKWGWDK